MARGEGRHEGGRKGGQGGRGGRISVSPATVEQYIVGIDYPCEKDDLIEQARANDAPEEVIHALQQCEERQYDSPTDVAQEIGKSG